MSKIFSFYNDNLDRAWYESSNIKYSECIDKENELKTLIIVFNNGTQYQYKKVDVRDYLMFRESASQGQALGKYIKAKGYEYEKMENVDIGKINEELEFRQNGGISFDYENNAFIVKDNTDKVVYSTSMTVTKDTFTLIRSILDAANVKYRVSDKLADKIESQNDEMTPSDYLNGKISEMLGDKEKINALKKAAEEFNNIIKGKKEE